MFVLLGISLVIVGLIVMFKGNSGDATEPSEINVTAPSPSMSRGKRLGGSGALADTAEVAAA
jgi:hypothetical protein